MRALAGRDDNPALELLAGDAAALAPHAPGQSPALNPSRPGTGIPQQLRSDQLAGHGSISRRGPPEPYPRYTPTTSLPGIARPTGCPRLPPPHRRACHLPRGLVRRISSGFMICRVWRGWTTKDNADAYERIVLGEVIPGIEARRIPGFRSIDVVRRERDHDVEFMTLMWFDTLDSVKDFVGEDYEAAHVPPQAQAVLTDFDERSAHYDVLDRRERPI